MPKEIERKFLVDKEKWEAVKKPKGNKIKQCYLLNEIEKTIRVRVKNSKGFLTIKGKTIGVTRIEFEYEIPLAEAEELIQSFGKENIEKIRYEMQIENHLWEVDVFKGENEGLIIAEIELASEKESFTKPYWVTSEVSENPSYYNANLIKNPFKNWE